VRSSTLHTLRIKSVPSVMTTSCSHLITVAAIVSAMPGLLLMTGYEKNRLLCLAFTDDLTTRKYQHFIWEGTKRGIQECQSQFQTERWNCSDSSFARVQPTGEVPFSSTLERGKEDSPSSTRMIKTQTMETCR